jgi:hypothetical protein
MDTLQKVTTPSSACNETYYYKKSHSNVAFFVRHEDDYFLDIRT